MPRSYFDLTAILGKLRKHAHGRKMSGILQTIGDLYSITNDLEMATELLEQFRASITISKAELNRDVGGVATNERMRVAQSLLINSILHYTRATHSKSNDRRTLQIRPKVTADQWSAHRALSALRDNAIAHYGFGPDNKKPWVDERMIMVFEGDDILIRPYFRRSRYQDWEANALDELIPIATALAAEQLESREAECLRLLNEVGPELGQIMMSTPIDMDSFFGTPKGHADTVVPGKAYMTWTEKLATPATGTPSRKGD